MQWGSAALVGGATTSLTACTAPSSDAISTQLVHGATGGGLLDTLDPHFPVTVPDIARVRSLYEPLMKFSPTYDVIPGLAESVEPNGDATQWTIRLREGVTFHHGKSVTSDDVLASFERMMDPDNPAPYAADIAPITDLDATEILDERTLRLHLTEPFVIMDTLLANYTLGIIPRDFDLASPVGTGPYTADVFVPGQRSRFLKNADYWGQQSAYDELVIINFADDAAKVNALLASQVHTIDNLPAYLAGAIEEQGARTLVSETGSWTPFTMRVDVEPFSDVRVRQAMRLIVDRQEMIDQALNGFGRLGNDLYAPFDPDYLGDDLPQRTQDIEQAQFLLKQAGHEDLQVELVTSSGIGTGAVESANLFAQQARRAGVQVRINLTDSNIFYGEQYLSWVFAQDFWDTRPYLPQVAASGLPTAPYNETHWNHEGFQDLVYAARQETDEARRRTLLQDAQQIEYDEGGFIIWAFKNQVDAYSQFVGGLEPHREAPVSAYRFNTAVPVEEP